jgi:ribonuclease HII
MVYSKIDNTLLICGIDEAGRGPLAGPVCAAAVILGSGFPNGNFPSGNFPNDLLNDSKKLTAIKREELRQRILENALGFGIGWASHTEIDNINILQASLLAMKRAFEEMLNNAVQNQISIPSENLSVIVDGNKLPDIPIPCKARFLRAMVKADAQIPEVMAASILAKTGRDSYMNEMALKYPQYGYDKHKGYSTKAHREAICKYGPSPIQRISFRYEHL